MAPRRRGGWRSLSQAWTLDPAISGGDIEEVTPDPIPNSEVKLFGADGTAREAVWESRTLPGLLQAEAIALQTTPLREREAGFRLLCRTWRGQTTGTKVGSELAFFRAP